MTKLHRIKSTDLSVLRSMLNEESESSNNYLSMCDRVENKTDLINETSKGVSDVRGELKKCSKNSREQNQLSGRANERPFLITRIESKHRSGRSKDSSNQVISTSAPSNSKTPMIPVYESIHHKSIVTAENRLEKKYEELGRLLNRDVLMRTVSICDQSINEARQLIQNSLATSRIVSSFIRDVSEPARITRSHTFGISRELDNPANDTVTERLERPDSGGVYERLSAVPDCDTHQPEPRTSTTRGGTDHVLASEEPFIQQWLARKNHELKMERRLKKEEEKIERAIATSTTAVKDQRKAASEEAFKRWLSTKKIDRRQSPDKPNSDSSTCSSTENLPQAGRQPRPMRRTFIRCSCSLTRPKSSATFKLYSNTKMKISGHHMSLSVNRSSLESQRIKIDYPKPIAKTEPRFIRPETAIPQSRNMNRNLFDIRSGLNESKFKKNKKKKRKSIIENGVEDCDIVCGKEDENLEGVSAEKHVLSENEFDKNDQNDKIDQIWQPSDLCSVERSPLNIADAKEIRRSQNAEENEISDVDVQSIDYEDISEYLESSNDDE